MLDARSKVVAFTGREDELASVEGEGLSYDDSDQVGSMVARGE
ncbi:hypothetical protein [Nocardiopsis sp. MG754419]|nr:hypothetical protein [Nocardiopsis sp. MG754419]